MGRIEACFNSTDIPPYIIEPADDPLPFSNLNDFEEWLRTEYIFRLEHSTSFYSQYNVECLGIFSPNETFLRCCLQYAFQTMEYPNEFQEFLRRKITSHNHPSGHLFSKDDIFTWAELEMQEIRVIVPNFREYRTFSIKRLNQRRPRWEEMKDLINAQDPGLHNFDSNPDYRHRCLLLLHDNGFFDYSVDPPF